MPDPSPMPELVAHARRLTQDRHPGAGKAWEQVAASGADLPGDVAAAVTRSKAGELMSTDPDAARTLLLDAADAFAELGDLDGELEALASAAVATQLAGQPQAAREAIREVAARAEDAFAGGTLTPRPYLNVRLSAQLTLMHALDAAAERDRADVDAVESGVTEILAVAEDLGQRYHVGRCHELLRRLADMRGDQGAAVEHLNASREAFLAVGAPWFAAIPEAMLAEFALRAGNGYAAERLAHDALQHGAGRFSPRQLAWLWSLIVQSISLQQGRAADLAMTRDQYGRSLRAIGRHKEAAEQFLEARRLAELLQRAKDEQAKDQDAHDPPDGTGCAGTVNQVGKGG